MVKPDLDLWTVTDPIFRVVNRFCILCLTGSRVGSGNGRVGFFLLLTPNTLCLTFPLMFESSLQHLYFSFDFPGPKP
ncbi:hypothetical protein Hanom_Chr08g00717621 [Helianthus anomalus]